MAPTLGDEYEHGEPSERCNDQKARRRMDATIQERRRLQETARQGAARDRAAEAAEAAVADEGDWFDEWGRRIECWWLATPHRAELGGCMGALALHIAQRFERLLRASQLPHAGAGSALMPGAQAGCEWIGSEAQLQLPEFPGKVSPGPFVLPFVTPQVFFAFIQHTPCFFAFITPPSFPHTDFGHLRFTLPPIPRLLPRDTQLQSSAARLRGEKKRDQLEEEMARRPLTVGAGAGAAVAALLVFALARKERNGGPAGSEVAARMRVRKVHKWKGNGSSVRP